MSNKTLFEELKSNLAASNWDIRKKWAQSIVLECIPINSFYPLLTENKKTATRFLWLLSDIASENKGVIYDDLPTLLKLSDSITHVDMKLAFTRLWQLCRVPVENESEAIELLFSYLISREIDVTPKSRALFVLVGLTNKYPELKNELKQTLLIERDKNTTDFRNRADKILSKL